jgi:hypothetical protein
MPIDKGYSGFAVDDKLGEKYEDDLAQDLCQQFSHLQGLRGTLEGHCEEIASRIDPNSKNMFQAHRGFQAAGDKRNQEILDTTGVIGLNRFAAILDSLLTPRNSFWHHLKPSDSTLLRDKNTMDWFSKVNSILFEHRYAPAANFAAQNQLVYRSLGGYGTGALLIDQLVGQKGIRYKSVHLGELFLQENHQGVVDRVCRWFPLSARQAAQKFGDKCPAKIRDRAKNQPEDLFYFLHWVMPRADRDPQRKDFKGMEYASYYLSIDEKKLVGEGGYRSFPFSVPRYEPDPQSAYGRSPAMHALPALKTINAQKGLVLKQGQLATDPVMLLHDDGIMDGASIESGSHLSGAITADGRLLVQPLPVGRVDIGKDLMDDERQAINDLFLVTLFQILVETPEMTATEVAERAREKGILLAPTVGGLQSGYLGPMIEREIDVLSVQGLLPPMPQFLRDAEGDYTIVYDSPISRTQKAEWVSGAMRSIEMTLNVAAQMQDPSKLFYYNWDTIIPEASEIMGTPSRWMNSAEQVAQLKSAMAQQQQIQTAIEAAPAAAGMMKAMK